MILKRAEELGRLVGQSDEYQALKRANDRLMADGGLTAKLEQMRTLQMEAEAKLDKGEAPSEATRAELDTLMASVQSHAAYQAFISAQSNFDKLMTKLNEQLYEGIRLGGESRIITLT
jgi:cell fate (sporulation/competence/biofilm development) regulator YlbF (YheA/YmcA/DUF963 family)